MGRIIFFFYKKKKKKKKLTRDAFLLSDGRIGEVKVDPFADRISLLKQRHHDTHFHVCLEWI